MSIFATMKHNDSNPNISPLLTGDECRSLKGLAIVCIILHNFCHRLPGAVFENEFTFNPDGIHRLWDLLYSHPSLCVMNLFSFFGHYGVPIFVFCTGYGLVQKYELRPVAVPVGRFLLSHYVKLVKLLLPAFAICIGVIFYYTGHSITSWSNFILQTTLLINFHPDAADIIKPGPYWYFGFVMQLYVIYRLLIYHRHWLWMVVLVAGCWLIQVIQQPDGTILEWIRYNFFMGTLPLVLGIIASRLVWQCTFNRLQWLTFGTLALMTLALSNLHFHTWLWCHVWVILAAIGVIKSCGKYLSRMLAWMGALSPFVFVLHPVARTFTIYRAFNHQPYMWLVVYLLLSFAFAWAFSYLWSKISAIRHQPCSN